MADDESEDIEECRRQLSVEEREAQAGYDRDAISSAPVDRLRRLGDRLTVARVLLEGVQPGAPPRIGGGLPARSPTTGMNCRAPPKRATSKKAENCRKAAPEASMSRVRACSTPANSASGICVG